MEEERERETEQGGEGEGEGEEGEGVGEGEGREKGEGEGRETGEGEGREKGEGEGEGEGVGRHRLPQFFLPKKGPIGNTSGSGQQAGRGQLNVEPLRLKLLTVEEKTWSTKAKNIEKQGNVYCCKSNRGGLHQNCCFLLPCKKEGQKSRTKDMKEGEKKNNPASLLMFSQALGIVPDKLLLATKLLKGNC